WNCEGRWCNVAVLPIREGQCDQGLAIACFAWDPHGAVKVDASAPLREPSRDFDRPPIGVFVWKLNRDNGMNVRRDTLTMVKHDSRALPLFRTWCSNPSVDLTARVATHQCLLVEIPQAHG